MINGEGDVRRGFMKFHAIFFLVTRATIGAPGIATRSKDATNGAPGRTTRNKKPSLDSLARAARRRQTS